MRTAQSMRAAQSMQIAQSIEHAARPKYRPDPSANAPASKPPTPAVDRPEHAAHPDPRR